MTAALPDSHYCPNCGYDQRGISSERCPECGAVVDRNRGGIIAWEQRAQVGYFKSFFSTLSTATFSPVRLARATGWPMDVRSARLFRWYVRLLVIVPCLALFWFAWSRFDAAQRLQSTVGNVFTSPLPAWKAQFIWIWSAGATLWPVLPIGFVAAVTLATRVEHWFYMKHLEPVRRNRAMAFSFYLCAPLGWIWVPCLPAAGAIYLASLDASTQSGQTDVIGLACGWILVLSSAVLVLALLNSIRAVGAATQCGIFRSMLVASGVVVQAAGSAVVGLALFPAIVGLWRLMIDGLAR